ncbi:MAG: DUF3175 domain-containing protein [Rhizobiales bacterium]|nr:DUF3175 domain-containing protein [Hyphomicrobiales bacterium]
MAKKMKKKAPKKAAKKKSAKKTSMRKRWSQKVTETSDAMTLEDGVFTKTPRAIAASLKRSAERSNRRKSSPFRSAMSMLTFYENRAGKNLSVARKTKIDKAKAELRALYHKD